MPMSGGLPGGLSAPPGLQLPQIKVDPTNLKEKPEIAAPGSAPTK